MTVDDETSKKKLETDIINKYKALFPDLEGAQISYIGQRKMNNGELLMDLSFTKSLNIPAEQEEFLKGERMLELLINTISGQIYTQRN